MKYALIVNTHCISKANASIKYQEFVSYINV